MFFKSISLLLVAFIGYFVVTNDLEYGEAVFVVMLPIATILGYLLLGTAD